MGVRRMKLNIYQKLHKAACEAGGVAKGKKVQGRKFGNKFLDRRFVNEIKSYLTLADRNNYYTNYQTKS